MLRTGRAAAVVALLLSTSAGGAAQNLPNDTASAVRQQPDGTVSIKASGTPLRSVLQDLMSSCALDVRIDAKAAARVVSIELADLDPALAVSEVLRGAGLDFAMHTRCGTPDKPALVIVSEPGGGPLFALLPRSDREERQSVPVIPPPSTPPPPPLSEEEAQRASVVATAAARDHHELAPGEVTGAMLAERLKTVEPSNEPVIELPFTDQNGEPYRQIRPPESRTHATLPFPDANGNVVVVPITTGPRPQTAGFPVYEPESAPAGKASGAQKSSGAAEARRPGGGR